MNWSFYLFCMMYLLQDSLKIHENRLRIWHSGLLGLPRSLNECVDVQKLLEQLSSYVPAFPSQTVVSSTVDSSPATIASLCFSSSLSLPSQKAFGGTTAPRYWSRNSTAASKKSCRSVLATFHLSALYPTDPGMCSPSAVIMSPLFSLPLPKPVVIKWTPCTRPWGLGRR